MIDAREIEKRFAAGIAYPIQALTTGIRV
jgi:hypothetical protein